MPEGSNHKEPNQSLHNQNAHCEPPNDKRLVKKESRVDEHPNRRKEHCT